MIDSVAKRARLLAAGALGALLFTAGPMAAQPSRAPLHEYRYYSDSSLSEEVGWELESCTFAGVEPGQVDGTRTPYVQSSIYGYCRDGEVYSST
ncbi:MAG TPA: hypothetical protein VE891_15670 [Allosphingosinicella sp.]|nr:hypothetical protein [Allosphingosinicella sp.]